MHGFTTVLTVAAAMALLLPATILGQTTSVEGRVIDSANGAPVAAADVRLRALTSGVEFRATTGDQGLFTVAGLALGRYLARIERVGYLIREDTVNLGLESVTRLEFELAPDPVLLPGVPAEGRAHAPLNAMSGFWERRERNIGHFITREDIDRLKPNRTADLFRRIPGTQIHPIGYGQVAIFARVRNADGRPCIPAMFVDGAPYVMTDRGLDDFNPASIEAIEVYSGSARIPPQFNATGRDQPRWRNDQIIGNPRCGVIVLWTRRTGG
jgi:hypothetical protein